MKFAIRDDDTCFFTKPSELEDAYDFIDKGCISLSVVPYTVPIHKDNVFPYGEGIDYGFYDINSNPELLDYLRNQVANGKYDILLHGYSHEYSKVNEIWTAEMIWKSQQQLERELTKGKRHLEELLGKRISVFVAPNNSINQKAISVIEELGMNYSGIIQKNDRKINARYLINFIRRWGYRAVLKIPYPGVLNYGKHKELIAFTLDNYDRLIKEYQACKKRGEPFVVYSHYWQINQNPNIKELLMRITDYVIKDGAELVPLSECF